MGSKDAPQKMQLFGAMKKWQVWVLFYKTQSAGKTPQIGPSQNQNRSESPKFLRIESTFSDDFKRTFE